MYDKLDQIYQLLIQNETIRKHTMYLSEDSTEKFRIHYYIEPETSDLTKPFIIIEPIGPPIDLVYGSNKPLNTKFTYQIDVQSKTRFICKELQRAINEELQKVNFYQHSGGFDEYFRDTQRFVDARKYTGNSEFYKTNY